MVHLSAVILALRSFWLWRHWLMLLLHYTPVKPYRSDLVPTQCLHPVRVLRGCRLLRAGDDVGMELRNLSVITDAKFGQETLSSTLFPGLSSTIEAHSGFPNEQAQTATLVLAAVQKAISTYGIKEVTLVGPSLSRKPPFANYVREHWEHGMDNARTLCSTGDVPTILQGNVNNHNVQAKISISLEARTMEWKYDY
ncbi:hypothetical protein DFH07DRAFT_765566 [Mycena maculata]|uniref:Uncharacterized protein n=1 Tax=Mycena maculata TaxID=230809 RepID=A0AAD7KCM8_9AGAR|nr:hypothetical protein DFH07DRAFT_765566 [Mycena maculata]